MTRYQLTPPALADLKEIAQYTLNLWGASKRDTYLDGLADIFDHVAQFPGLGLVRPGIDPAIRSFIYEEHFVFYEMIDEQCYILRVIHHGRDLATIRFARR